MKKIVWSISMLSLISILLQGCYKECECPKSEEKTLTSQPGPNDGQDCTVAYRETDGGVYAAGNHNVQPELGAARWTWSAENAGEGTYRAYVKFPELSQVPQNALVKSAKLSLYGPATAATVPQGNSYYPGSPYFNYGSNKCWLKRATANWEEGTLTWNNKPATTDAGQVEVNGSTTQWNYHATEIDVTQFVKDMVANNQNYGFVLQLQNEQIYRSIVFSSSEATDATKRPKLVVVYETQQ